ncbi:MAG TPA: hypothetical protein VLE22_02325 [Bryobacteraceae bacterium]|nr:hypothetical protein [Bryobacteraceae bacterium]
MRRRAPRNRHADLVFNNINPTNGIVEIRFTGNELRGTQCEAVIEALEIGAGYGGSGDTPKTVVGL